MKEWRFTFLYLWELESIGLEVNTNTSLSVRVRSIHKGFRVYERKEACPFVHTQGKEHTTHPTNALHGQKVK